MSFRRQIYFFQKKMDNYKMHFLCVKGVQLCGKIHFECPRSTIVLTKTLYDCDYPTLQFF